MSQGHVRQGKSQVGALYQSITQSVRAADQQGPFRYAAYHVVAHKLGQLLRTQTFSALIQGDDKGPARNALLEMPPLCRYDAEQVLLAAGLMLLDLSD